MTASLRSTPPAPGPYPEVRELLSVRPAPSAELRPAAVYVPQPDFDPFAESAAAIPDPYVDYGRFLTAEGGILFLFKDLDERLRHTLWRVFAWTTATGCEGWYLFHWSPVQSQLITFAAIGLLALTNWLIVAKPIEVHRSLEIRPDCMIVEGEDVFWRSMMEIDVPRFTKNDEGHHVLSGVYGTRFVEFLTVRKFDDLDRTPEVFENNLAAAMRQVWGGASFVG